MFGLAQMIESQNFLLCHLPTPAAAPSPSSLRVQVCSSHSSPFTNVACFSPKLLQKTSNEPSGLWLQETQGFCYNTQIADSCFYRLLNHRFSHCSALQSTAIFRYPLQQEELLHFCPLICSPGVENIFTSVFVHAYVASYPEEAVRRKGLALGKGLQQSLPAETQLTPST